MKRSAIGVSIAKLPTGFDVTWQQGGIKHHKLFSTRLAAMSYELKLLGRTKGQIAKFLAEEREDRRAPRFGEIDPVPGGFELELRARGKLVKVQMFLSRGEAGAALDRWLQRGEMPAGPKARAPRARAPKRSWLDKALGWLS